MKVQEKQSTEITTALEMNEKSILNELKTMNKKSI